MKWYAESGNLNGLAGFGAIRGSALLELLIVLPLLLLILGGVIDYSRTLADRASLIEVARTVGRAASRTWVLDEHAIDSNATLAATMYLQAAGFDPASFQTRVQILELRLGGNRFTKSVEIRIVATGSVRAFQFLRGLPEFPLTASAAYRLQNALVEISDVN